MSKPGLTKRQRRLLGPYVREVADGLNLRDWRFEILHEPIHSTDEATARLTSTFGRHTATLEFCADFPRMPRDVQREIVVHELLHCWLPAVRAGGWWGIDHLVGEPAMTVFRSAYEEHVELAVDGIANAIAPLFPLPPDLTAS